MHYFIYSKNINNFIWNLSSIFRLRNRCQYIICTQNFCATIAWTSGKLTFYKFDSRRHVIRITAYIRMDIGEVLCGVIHDFSLNARKRNCRTVSYAVVQDSTVRYSRAWQTWKVHSRGNLTSNFIRQKERELEREKERKRERETVAAANSESEPPLLLCHYWITML